MSKKSLILAAVVLVSVRVAFMAFPSVWLATALWLVAGPMIFAWAQLLRRRAIPLYGAVLVGVGAMSNGLVMLLNGGVMPVHGLEAGYDGMGVWRSAAEGGHLLALADYMALGGMSPGDVLIAIGILFSISVVLFRGVRSLANRLRPTAAASNVA